MKSTIFLGKSPGKYQDLTFGAALDPGVDRLQRGCSPNRRLFLWVLLAGEIRINHDLVGFNGI